MKRGEKTQGKEKTKSQPTLVALGEAKYYIFFQSMFLPHKFFISFTNLLKS